MYNKRNMEILKREIENDKHDYLIKALAYLEKAEKTEDKAALDMAQHHLEEALPKLEENDQKGWRRELLLNYFLNLELQIYKKKDSGHTKWTVFLEKIQENAWKTLEKFANEIDQYLSSQKDPNNVENLTEEKLQRYLTDYETKIVPYIEKNLGKVDRFRAELRITQRLNLLKKKVPANSNLSFGDWVKEKRTALNWSLGKLAEESGYSPAYIFRIEKGTRKNPTPQVVSRIVTALGYKPDDYLSMIFDKQSQPEADELKKIELSDLIRMSHFTVNGEEVSSQQRELLAQIVDLINEDDVLRVPKINQLKQTIKSYQETF